MTDIIARAVEVLRRDGLVVYPTDTVYGLGADALSEEAVMKVYEAKGRPFHNPISVAVCDMEMLCCIARVSPPAEALIERFLPGPMTVILPAKSVLPPLLMAGTGQIGVRIPDHEIALSLVRVFDAPITATSANRTGERNPRSEDEVQVPHDLLISGGTLPGVPSTVVDPDRRQILRPGTQAEEIEAFLATLR
ncbi:MAG: threonylcarbamoyl-AMP synthase [Methanomicrobiales archaeon]|nr:threonylcarbamoyl-AMP synthase [Methanomicrobiales archaeon]